MEDRPLSEGIEWDSVDFTESNQFDEIHAAFATLALRDKRLGLAKFVASLTLGQPGSVPRLSEAKQEILILNNVVFVPQTYNQHRGAGGHTAAMPEKLAEFFIKACAPAGGVVIDPFAGSGTTTVAARRLGRRAGGLEIHQEYVDAAHGRLRGPRPDDIEVVIDIAP